MEEEVEKLDSRRRFDVWTVGSSGQRELMEVINRGQDNVHLGLRHCGPRISLWSFRDFSKPCSDSSSFNRCLHGLLARPPHPEAQVKETPPPHRPTVGPIWRLSLDFNFFGWTKRFLDVWSETVVFTSGTQTKSTCCFLQG